MSTNPKSNPAEAVALATTEIVKILSTLDLNDRDKAINAAMTIFGSVASTGPANSATQALSGTATINAVAASEKQFFDQKKPDSKIEELATAARFLELNQNTTTLEKASIERVIRAARRNFDSRNFVRDLNNAKTKGFFARDREIALTYYGQEFIDALPNREAVNEIRKPKAAGRRSKKKKKEK